MFSEHVIDAISKRLDANIDYAHWETLVSSLAFTHQVITASEGLLADAIALSEGDLKAYYSQHLQEELNHAEWLSQDLQSSGIDTRKIPKLRRAVEMAGSQYYLVKHGSPLSLLGYMAVLEGFPTSLAAIEAMESLHGKDLLRTLRYHAIHDVAHRKDLFAMIDQFPCEEIMQSAMLTVQHINEFTDDLRSGALWAFIKEYK